MYRCPRFDWTPERRLLARPGEACPLPSLLLPIPWRKKEGKKVADYAASATLVAS